MRAKLDGNKLTEKRVKQREGNRAVPLRASKDASREHQESIKKASRDLQS